MKRNLAQLNIALMQASSTSMVGQAMGATGLVCLRSYLRINARCRSVIEQPNSQFNNPSRRSGWHPLKHC